jgi:hypothetical protein
MNCSTNHHLAEAASFQNKSNVYVPIFQMERESLLGRITGRNLWIQLLHIAYFLLLGMPLHLLHLLFLPKAREDTLKKASMIKNPAPPT